MLALTNYIVYEIDRRMTEFKRGRKIGWKKSLSKDKRIFARISENQFIKIMKFRGDTISEKLRNVIDTFLLL